MTQGEGDERKVEFEHLRLELERQKWAAESRLRERELEIKFAEQGTREAELELKRQEQSRAGWWNPLVVVIFAAAIAAAGNAVVSIVNGIQERRIEDQKSEQARILEMIKTGDTEAAAENLQFLLDSGLIDNRQRAAKLSIFLAKRTPGTGPSLPSGSRDIRARRRYLSDLKPRPGSLYNLRNNELLLDKVTWMPYHVVLGGVPYTKAVVFLIGDQDHNASVEYELNGHYSEFRSDIGVAGQTPPPCHGSVIFRVYVDGQRKFESDAFNMEMAAKPIPPVSLAGADVLKLEANDADGDVKCDHAAWGNAVLVSGVE